MSNKLLLLAVTTLALTATLAPAADAYKWSVQYLIDNSQSVFGREQKVWPRRNRGLALSPDGKYLYAGYHHGGDGMGEVRRIAVEVPDYERATVAVLRGPLGKSIATDDKGRVYITDTSDVLVYDAGLEQRLFKLSTGGSDGVAVVRDGGQLLLFATVRGEGTIRRWVLTEKDDGITEAKPAGFDGTGIFKIPGASDVRGIEVDAQGSLWVCDYAGKVYKVRKDGKDVKSVEVKSPMDVAVDGNRVFVTRGPDRSITVMDNELVVIGSLNVPWEELEVSPYGNNRLGALSGIAAVAGKGFFVANESGQTGNQKSTYGKADDKAALIDGKLFRDAEGDDNDPILKATAVAAGP